MAACSCIAALKIPLAEEPGGLQSTGWKRAEHDSIHACTRGTESSVLQKVLQNNCNSQK